jgi:uncharacterized protein (DUF2126 family)/transglutaminase-like putative cysteine protease
LSNVGIHVGIEHRTLYRFDRSVTINPHVLRLRPAPHCRTPILAYSLKVEPSGHFINWQQDPFGNFVARLVFTEQARELSITVDLVADLTVVNPFDFFVEDSAQRYPFTYEPRLAADLEPYLRPDDELGPMLESWLKEVRWRREGEPIVDFLVAVNNRLKDDVAYSVRMEPGVQTPDETLARAIGSCRDSAWLLVQVLRRLGLAARFVSGYLVQLSSDVAALDGPGGPIADFTDLHAWTEVFIPGAGWVGLDPTSGLFAGEGHIPLACTPHPESAAPVTGSTGVAEVQFEYTNVVHRVREDPRVTLPYTPEQWGRIDELGERVDDLLRAGDVRLTMGGEPTFVSIDDMEGAAWNTDADSPAKRLLALDITDRLAARFAPGRVIQHGQGKWYPGEALPRWQIGIVWRHDDFPMWTDPTLLADPWTPGKRTQDDAARVAVGIASRFGILSDHVLPAYEDPLARIAFEARLPAGERPTVDLAPDDPMYGSPESRSEFVREVDVAVPTPTGWVLPLHPDPDTGGWGTTEWLLRRGRLVLIPGDSPVGLRLPLDSLTWSDWPPVYERSPFEPRDALPQPSWLPRAPAREVERHLAPPTALCVELRDGNVCVFLPPLQHIEHGIELLSVVESVAAEHGCPVVLEGYGLPRDPRTSTLVVTPDPGVIEVNVHPSSSWAQFRDVMTTLYEEARLARLGTEKFAVDGMHTGTGGGNHITLGGATPADSPMLRRPDLLRSMLTFWQHHPSLSYLFSGRFIGPTSQAPRVDEARHENLYELEIAFAELSRLGPDAAPWMVDRLLRHLLVDLTGNTHRAEFCIDKLFSPDSERGRLGLLELRGFEMPPHPQMAMVQGLLIRALVARFWNNPYEGSLVRWGTDLHDQFMLPWFVAADAREVVEDLQRHGFAFDPDWLAPFLEFRFPLIGEVEVDDVRLELRSAIEPWHVLGEETTAGGTARYVDSSVERLQVLVQGFNPARHLVTCNLIPVPLLPTASSGVAVGGVRFKAWNPWSALHPTIDVHGPLVFDVIDKWSGRSLGGCTYHVSHPGGRSYDTFPVNANEAEARRASRFFRTGHTPGAVDVPGHADRELFERPEYPRTLDLRRFVPR